MSIVEKNYMYGMEIENIKNTKQIKYWQMTDLFFSSVFVCSFKKKSLNYLILRKHLNFVFFSKIINRNWETNVLRIVYRNTFLKTYEIVRRSRKNMIVWQISAVLSSSILRYFLNLNHFWTEFIIWFLTFDRILYRYGM